MANCVPVLCTGAPEERGEMAGAAVEALSAYFSNRAAALLSMNRPEKALKDAEATVFLLCPYLCSYRVPIVFLSCPYRAPIVFP